MQSPERAAQIHGIGHRSVHSADNVPLHSSGSGHFDQGRAGWIKAAQCVTMTSGGHAGAGVSSSVTLAPAAAKTSTTSLTWRPVVRATAST